MEVLRCRFVDVVPSAITAIALAPSGGRAAVGRQNGDLEIWHTESSEWRIERRIAGGLNVSIRAVVWHGDTRLLSAGLSGEITEWDLRRLAGKRSVDSYGGAVWCMALRPTGDKVAIGCDDGCVRLFRIDQEDLVYERSFDKQEGRVLCMAWHADGQGLAAGCSDGTVRRYEGTTGRPLFRITLQTYGRGSSPVWAVCVLRDWTIVTGDAFGHVQFWDGRMGTLLHTFRQHEADVMSIVASREDDRVFAAGVDSRICMFIRVKTAMGSTGEEGAEEVPTKWAVSGGRRPHTHDIRSLAISQTKKHGDVLVSGGTDTILCVHSLSAFPTLPPARILPFQGPSHVTLAHDSRLLLAREDRCLHIWKLGSGNPRKLVEIHIKDDENIMCMAIAPNGSYVAASTVSELKFFALDVRESGMSVRKVNLPDHFPPCHRLLFSTDSSRLILATQEAAVAIVDLRDMRILRTFKQHQGGEGDDDNNDDGDDAMDSSHGSVSPIVSLATSADGQWLASGDLQNRIHVFHLDSLKHHCTLPVFDSPHTALCFHPPSSTLVVTCASRKFYLYDIEEKEICEWTREYVERLPQALLTRKDPMCGVIFNPAAPNTMVVYGLGFLCFVDLEAPVLEHAKQPQHRHRQHRLPKTQETNQDQVEVTEDGPHNFHIVDKFRPLLFADFLEGNKMVVVERPWVKVLQHLPNALEIKRYGT